MQAMSPHFRPTAPLLLFLGTLFSSAAAGAGNAGEPDVALAPATLTATRNPEQTAPASPFPTDIFGRSEIDAAPDIRTDDFLRRLPSFSLFRRTSSLGANPTTQGASLRGIGPSGASRTLVLYDGVPFNDAFGGWVYWSQIDLEAVERIEVVRGGGSAAWGNTALGGVIQIVPRRPEAGTLETTAHYGNRDTGAASVYASERFGPLGVAAEARYFSSDGYKRVAPEQRGSIDRRLHSRHRVGKLTIDYEISETARLTLRGTAFSEERGNGTPLANNETENFRGHAKLEWESDAGARWRSDFYAGTTDFTNSFTAVSADRNSEQLALDQFSVPSENIGASIRRSGDLRQFGALTTGADIRYVEGETNERVVFQGDDRIAGGSQLLAGMFAEHEIEYPRNWQWHLGVRGDFWQIADGFRKPPNEDRISFGDRERFISNVRAGLTRTFADLPIALRASVYQAFRTPTVNELYRPFQVGNDVTRANADLEAEQLTGGEIGFDLFPGGSTSFRTTAYWNRVDDPILNVTIGTSDPGGQLRQRRNIGRTRIRGLESEFQHRSHDGWRVFANHALIDARVRESSDQPGLEGNHLAQVPRHVLTGGIGYEPGKKGFGFSLEGRWTDDQFEDDTNGRELGAFWRFDLEVRYQFAPGQRIFVTVENLFDRRFTDGITGDGLVTQGAPRFVHVGVDYAF